MTEILKIDFAMRFRRLLSEPLSLFLLIAAGIFLLDAWRAGSSEASTAEWEAHGEAGSSAAPDLYTIAVSKDIVDALVEEFNWLEGRQPDAAEREALVSAWIDDEIVFRAALSRQMHLNDAKMREHLIEKMRLLWAGVPPEPDEQELLDYYLDNIKRYYSEPRLSFEQVFFEDRPADPRVVLERLNAGETVSGDPFWLGANMKDYAASILKTSFGGAFYQALLSAPKTKWIGPLESPRGFHFVSMTGIRKAAPLAYEDVRERLAREWSNGQMQRQVARSTEALRESFKVEWEDRRRD